MIASSKMADKMRITCVAGPTASGKSGLAVRLAKEEDGEVISVDSRQVYKTLDIGTEKIRPEEMDGVPHHLIDIRDPETPYSAGEFLADATRLIEDITNRGKLPILAGGTHFYFDSLLYGLPPETPPDPELRDKLETLANEELYALVTEKDAHRAERLDPENRRRLIRALEVIEKHGHVPERHPEPLYNVEWHILNPDREELADRIEVRLRDAMKRGLVEEVRRTRLRVGDERLNELGLEYKVVGEYLRGERGEDGLVDSLVMKLKHYARRQRAWLRKIEEEYQLA